jgi:peptide deformylase
MAKILEITIYPDDILRKTSKEIGIGLIGSKDLSMFVEDMKKTMSKKDGVGLAAPQVGKNIRLVVIQTKNKIVAMINPKITHRSIGTEVMEEGCLSVPNYFGNVRRPKKITCSYIDEHGARMKVESEGLMARVIQHEIDHLDGVLFIDKAVDLKNI